MDSADQASAVSSMLNQHGESNPTSLEIEDAEFSISAYCDLEALDGQSNATIDGIYGPSPASGGSASLPTQTPVSEPTEPSETIPPAQNYSGAGELTPGNPGQEVADVCSSDSLTIYAFTPETAALRELASFNLDDVLSGWSDVSVNCDRDGFDADFTKLLFSADPSGVDESHIGYVDLTDSHVVDLTAARQGSSFQSTVLDENAPEFLGAGNGALTFGSDQIAFSDTNGGSSVTSISNPTKVTSLANGVDPTADPETTIQSGSAEASGTGSQYNPSFTLMVKQGEDANGNDIEQVAALPPSQGPVTLTCAVPDGDYLNPIGWSDDTHLVLEIENDDETADGVIVATVDPTSLAIQCGSNILPANDRSPTNFGLTYDGTAVTFDAESEAGNTLYKLPLSGGSPTPYTMPSLPSDLDIWTK
jgi:hypothetical protein